MYICTLLFERYWLHSTTHWMKTGVKAQLKISKDEASQKFEKSAKYQVRDTLKVLGRALEIFDRQFGDF